MKKLMYIKLGGALVTKDKLNTLNTRKIRELAKEIHKARKKFKFKLVLGNGAGSFGHILAKKYKITEGVKGKKSIEGFARVREGVSNLNNVIVKELIQAEEMAVSMQPSALAFSKDNKITDFNLKPFLKLLEYDFVPVVYGDGILDEKKGCSVFSTERIFDHLSDYIKPEKIIMITNVEGVLNNKGDLIDKITKENYPQVKNHFKKSTKIDVTGGMAHKVEKAIEFSKKGIDVFIIGGKKGNLSRLLEGEKTGTQITGF